VVGGVLIGAEATGVQAEHFGRAWAEHRATELSVHTRYRLGIFPEILRGDILEIGAGDGALARFRPDLRIFSTDLVLDGIRDLGKAAATCLSTALPFKDDSFDVVVAFEILEHLTPAERKTTLAEVHRVLRHQGQFLVSVPTWPMAWLERAIKALRSRCWPTLRNLQRWDHPHEIRFARGQLESELDGFDILTVHYWARSGTALGTFLLNPVMSRLNLPERDVHWLDRWTRWDHPSNQIILARVPDLVLNQTSGGLLPS
jgi:SAM-dependent methyltransferase